MRSRYLLNLSSLLMLLSSALPPTHAGGLNTRQVSVQVQANAPDLICPTTPAKPKKPKPSPQPDAPDAPEGPLGIPEPQEVLQALAEADVPGMAPPAVSPAPKQRGPAWSAVAANQTFRVAFWGDSHLAAGFFTQELGRRAGLEPDQVHSAFVPATLTRPGVRLPVRKACASAEWRHESAHAVPAAAQAPGPALVNQFATKPDASLSWDLRNAQRLPVHHSLRFLFQQTDSPIRIAIRVDGSAEQELQLDGTPGPAALDLQADAPLSTLHLRLLEGSLRSHGLALPVASSARLQVDLFALPGATVRGWQHANLDYLRSWFADTPPYQLVALAYGTNEGNEKPFDPAAYAQTLRQSVTQLRQVFPQVPCMLIGPGDRGLLVPRQRQVKASAKKPKPAVNLLKYSSIHTQITRIQHTVGAELGCQSWSMMQAMGGKASSYAWARLRPPLMAHDLIHFTVPGYQRLAQTFADDMGWTPQTLWLAP